MRFLRSWGDRPVHAGEWLASVLSEVDPQRLRALKVVAGYVSEDGVAYLRPILEVLRSLHEARVEVDVKVVVGSNDFASRYEEVRAGWR